MTNAETSFAATSRPNKWCHKTQLTQDRFCQRSADIKPSPVSCHTSICSKTSVGPERYIPSQSNSSCCTGTANEGVMANNGDYTAYTRLVVCSASVERWSWRSTKLLYTPGLHPYGWPVRGSTPGAWNLSQYITSHPSQLGMAIPPWVMSTRQRAVMLCGWGVKTSMHGREWVAWQVKPCDPLANARAISECFRWVSS